MYRHIESYGVNAVFVDGHQTSWKRKYNDASGRAYGLNLRSAAFGGEIRMLWLDDEGGCFVSEWPMPSVWPPSSIEFMFELKKYGPTVQGYATPEGKLVLLLFDRNGTVLNRFVSQPIAALGVAKTFVKVGWNRCRMRAGLARFRLESLETTAAPLEILF